MQAKLPVLAYTDSNTDIGKTILDGGFGWWCESDDAKSFSDVVRQVMKDRTQDRGENAFQCLKVDYTAGKSYVIIMDSIKETLGQM